jgi:hypothetical protein
MTDFCNELLLAADKLADIGERMISGKPVTLSEHLEAINFARMLIAKSKGAA